MNIRFFALGLASVLLSSPAAADNLTISSKTTSPVSTAAAANNSPGDITIDANGSVEVSRSGYSVLLNSSNAVANSGTISNAGGSGAIGLEIVPGFTGSVNNSGTINVITTGTSPTTTGQFGILLMNGNNISFTGTAANAATSLTASSVVGVIMPGDLVSGATGFANGTYIVSQNVRNYRRHGSVCPESACNGSAFECRIVGDGRIIPGHRFKHQPHGFLRDRIARNRRYHFGCRHTARHDNRQSGFRHARRRGRVHDKRAHDRGRRDADRCSPDSAL